MAKKQWKAIRNYEGLYEVSNAGEVRSVDREIRNAVGVSRTYKGRLLRPRTISSGYLQVLLCQAGTTEARLVHRLVAEAFLANPNRLPVVMHVDDNKHHNQSSNLQWGTYQDNVLDMISKGRVPKRPPKPPRVRKPPKPSKLADGQVKKIEKLLAKGMEQKEVANLFDVSQTTICRINLGLYRTNH